MAKASADEARRICREIRRIGGGDRRLDGRMFGRGWSQEGWRSKEVSRFDVAHDSHEKNKKNLFVYTIQIT